MEKQLLCDYKTVSTWKIQYKDFHDWYRQGLIYAYLMNKAGLNVKRCKFIALLKDHSKGKARTDSSYPQSPVYVYQFDVTADALKDIENFITEKVKNLELQLKRFVKYIKLVKIQLVLKLHLKNDGLAQTSGQ